MNKNKIDLWQKNILKTYIKLILILVSFIALTGFGNKPANGKWVESSQYEKYLKDPKQVDGILEINNNILSVIIDRPYEENYLKLSGPIQEQEDGYYYFDLDQSKLTIQIPSQLLNEYLEYNDTSWAEFISKLNDDFKAIESPSPSESIIFEFMKNPKINEENYEFSLSYKDLLVIADDPSSDPEGLDLLSTKNVDKVFRILRLKFIDGDNIAFSRNKRAEIMYSYDESLFQEQHPIGLDEDQNAIIYKKVE